MTPDKNYKSFADVDNLYISNVCFKPSSEEFDDILKLSHATNCVVSNVVVFGGKENAIDLNRTCENITILGCRLYGGRQAAIVVKGGCKNIYISGTQIAQDPSSWCDVLVDDWSDQSRKASEVTLVSCYREDGKPLRIVFGRFRKPKIASTNYRILWLPTISLHLYNILKGFWVSIRN